MSELELTGPVRRQLEAYNNRDIEAFMSCYAPTCVVEDGEGNVLMENWDVMKASYADLFVASPELHCTIVARTVVGNYVLDEEHVTGRRGNTGVGHVVAVYRVADGLIQHVRFLR
ncbi:MAG: nuclear transport factor 2 family protein [Tumebacillaceae bacterium]